VFNLKHSKKLSLKELLKLVYHHAIRIAAIVIAIAAVIYVIMQYKHQSQYANIKKNVTYVPYYVSVAHIPYPDAWKLLEVDTSKDTAYYMVDKDLIDFTFPENNEPIHLVTKEKGTIIEISPNGFTIEMEDGNSIMPGLSGSPVFNDKDEILGYVSATTGNKLLYCIWR